MWEEKPKELTGVPHFLSLTLIFYVTSFFVFYINIWCFSLFASYTSVPNLFNKRILAKKPSSSMTEMLIIKDLHDSVENVFQWYLLCLTLLFT